VHGQVSAAAALATAKLQINQSKAKLQINLRSSKLWTVKLRINQSSACCAQSAVLALWNDPQQTSDVHLRPCQSGGVTIRDW
jgi:hypothetical protein